MPSATHLVLIPSYNTGPRLVETAADALRFWDPVWIVIDGSTDASARDAAVLAAADPRLRVIVRPARGGKGAAVATGAAEARQAGFTHALILDADGQHPADRIAEFMAVSGAHPEALVLGRPIFGPEAPAARLYGRKLSIAIARVEILGPDIADPLFGFRVYPLDPLLRAFRSTGFARGYDFDHETAVRVFWFGAPVLNLPASCRYFSARQGGVSHFRYVRDNAVLTAMNLRLTAELLLWRWPGLLMRRLRRRPTIAACLLLASLAAAPRPAPAAEVVIAHPESDPAWQDVLPRLAAMGNRSCSFEERRFFPFRTAPVVLYGDLRFDPARGLSLHYTRPEERLLVVGRRGLLIRSHGQTEVLPAGQDSLGPLSALLPVMEFDLRRLPRLFVLRGERRGAAWTLDLVPREAALARQLASVRISGEAGSIERVIFDLGAGQRIELGLGPIHPHVVFSPRELKAYFP